jgi:hypothetical protein
MLCLLVLLDICDLGGPDGRVHKKLSSLVREVDRTEPLQEDLHTR